MQNRNTSYHTLRGIGLEAGKMARKILGSHGAGLADLISDWENVVGPELAEHTLPLKLSFPPQKRDGGTLDIRTPSAFAAQLQHMTPQVISRINTHFGYAAVSRIRITQGNPSREHLKKQEPPKKPLTSGQKEDIANRISEIPDENLRKTLQALGEAILSK
ncbi:MAG TPA: DUF721 domain-containing protein [Rhodospirillaceae bacterium]|nr:MAG: hypothetical protein A2018_04940 [Alphaproteobacteria bacterium GWF2_58_20]HAU28863.1 DUF721 domain-containing protein [Rhodospirillaceae bacterium]